MAFSPPATKSYPELPHFSEKGGIQRTRHLVAAVRVSLERDEVKPLLCSVAGNN